MNRVTLPDGPGSYRWYYVDVSSGDFTAVVIFMVGSIFSARYSSAQRRGGEPREHAAVNFALYEKGARWQWVLSEYQAVTVEDDGAGLRIGASTLRYTADGRLRIEVVDQTPLWGKPARVGLELEARGPGHAPLRLVEGLEHWWHPIAPRAHARVTVPLQELEFEGRAYHDGNHGQVPLGSDLRGWDWVRTHEDERTRIKYRPWHPDASADRAWQVDVSANSVEVSQPTAPPAPPTRTNWGLQVPSTLGVAGKPRLLESSPFYARLEREQGASHSLGEVADFRRFHSPWIRWMARLRTRMAPAQGAV